MMITDIKKLRDERKLKKKRDLLKPLKKQLLKQAINEDKMAKNKNLTIHNKYFGKIYFVKYRLGDQQLNNNGLIN